MNLYDLTDITAGKHRGADTSVAAHARISATLPAARLAVLRVIRERPGATLDEIAEAVGKLPHQISGRVSELMRDGLIEVCGRSKNVGGNWTRMYREAK